MIFYFICFEYPKEIIIIPLSVNIFTITAPLKNFLPVYEFALLSNLSAEYLII